MQDVTVNIDNLLLTWLNFNPFMDKEIHAPKLWDEVTYLSPKLNGYTVKVYKWISNLIINLSKLIHVSRRAPGGFDWNQTLGLL